MSLVLQEVVWSHFPCTLTIPTDIFCRFEMFILLTASHPVLQELFKEHVGFLFVKKTYQASMRSLPGQGIRFVSCLQSGAWAHRSLCVFLCCAGTRGDTWALEWVAGMARGDAALVPAAETPSTAGPSAQGHMKKCFIMTCSSGSAVPGDFLLRLVLSMFITSDWEMLLLTVFC